MLRSSAYVTSALQVVVMICDMNTSTTTLQDFVALIVAADSHPIGATICLIFVLAVYWLTSRKP